MPRLVFPIAVALATVAAVGCTHDHPEDTADTSAEAFFAVYLTDRSPAPNATDVAVDVQPRAEFQAPLYLDPDSSDPALIQLYRGSTRVPGSARHADEGTGDAATTWWFEPASPLAWSTRYDVVLSGDAVVPEDVARGAGARAGGLGEEIRWHFDTLPLPFVELTGVSPADHATGVRIDAPISATFSLPIDPDTVTGESFVLSDSEQALGGDYTVSGNTVTFTPYDDLHAATTYTVALTTDLRSTSGLPLATDVTTSFTTVDPLTLTGMSPAPGATGVTIGTRLTLTFSADIDPGTVTNTTIQPRSSKRFLNGYGVTVPGTVAVSGNQLTFTPSTGYWQEYETTFTVLVDPALRGVGGEPVRIDLEPTFTTLFFDPSKQYTMHVLGYERTRNLDLNGNLVAQFSGNLGVPTSRWVPVQNGSYWAFHNAAYMSGGTYLSGKVDPTASLMEFPPSSGVWQNQAFTPYDYGGHGNWTQNAGDSPSLYYLRTEQFGAASVMTVSWDANLGIEKVTLKAPTGSIYQLFWFHRYN